jgi:hypothetical protein
MTSEDGGSDFAFQDPWHKASVVDFLERDVDDGFASITHTKIAYIGVRLIAIVIVLQAIATSCETR